MNQRIHFSSSIDYKNVIRHIQLLPRFDRTGLALMCKVPYGTVARIVSELLHAGHLRSTGRTAPYSRQQVNRNPDLTGVRLNYAGNRHGLVQAEVLKKTETWSAFITQWRTYVVTHPTKVPADLEPLIEWLEGIDTDDDESGQRTELIGWLKDHVQ